MCCGGRGKWYKFHASCRCACVADAGFISFCSCCGMRCFVHALHHGFRRTHSLTLSLTSPYMPTLLIHALSPLGTHSSTNAHTPLPSPPLCQALGLPTTRALCAPSPLHMSALSATICDQQCQPPGPHGPPTPWSKPTLHLRPPPLPLREIGTCPMKQDRSGRSILPATFCWEVDSSCTHRRGPGCQRPRAKSLKRGHVAQPSCTRRLN